MKILVDEMPKEGRDCLFAVEFEIPPFQDYSCVFNSPCWLEVKGRCPYLKEYKPEEDDCK